MTSGVIAQVADILRGASSERPGPQLLDAARYHRVDRLVAWRTGQVGPEQRADALIDELHVRELNRVLAALEDAALSPLVLKGAALAHTHYEQSWLRPRLDADVLIPESQKLRACDVLHALGYTQPPFTSGELVMHQTPFVRTGEAGAEHVVDLHWRVANPHAVADVLTYDELLSRARVISVRGQSLRTPSAADALLLACVHRAAHHDNSDELLWLYDIHLIAERLGSHEWCDLVDRASTRRVRALCAGGLQSAVARFKTSVPPGVLSQLATVGRPREPSAVYLRLDLTRVEKLMVDLAALAPRAGLRLVWEHLAPPPGYIQRKYAVRRVAFLPAFYARRILSGTWKWLRGSPIDRTMGAGRQAP